MFFQFTSNTIYPKRMWKWVWDFEKITFAILVDNIPLARTMGRKEVEKWLCSEVKKLANELGISKDAQKIFCALQRLEMDSIVRFIKGAGPINKANVIKIKHLHPDRIMLKRCLAESKGFRKHILERGKSTQHSKGISSE